MKYRKKPVEIEAVLYDGNNGREVAAFISNADDEGASDFYGLDGEILIDTLEGTMRASVGDWIIKGVKGEFYPVKPGVFVLTYEAVVGDPEIPGQLRLDDC